MFSDQLVPRSGCELFLAVLNYTLKVLSFTVIVALEPTRFLLPWLCCTAHLQRLSPLKLFEDMSLSVRFYSFSVSER